MSIVIGCDSFYAYAYYHKPLSAGRVQLPLWFYNRMTGRSKVDKKRTVNEKRFAALLLPGCDDLDDQQWHDEDSILRPVFEVGERVYAPWKDEVTGDTRWYSGSITSRKTISVSEYGPLRQYNVLFDEGNDVGNDIYDYNIFSVEDYKLNVLSPDDDEEIDEDFKQYQFKWVGVSRAYDEKSKDYWAEKIGWYEYEINAGKSSI